MFLSGTMPQCSFPSCSPHTSSSYFFYPTFAFPRSTQRCLYADGFSGESSTLPVSSRIVCLLHLLSPPPFSAPFLLPSTSNLSHSILSPSLSSSLFLSSSTILVPWFSFSRLPIHCPPVSELHIYAAWSHVLTRVSRKNLLRDSPISAPTFSQIAPLEVPLYSRGDFWIVV